MRLPGRPFLATTDIDLAFSWPRHDERTLGDLVERLDGMLDEADRLSVWNIIDDWSETQADEEAKAELREIIRVTARQGLLRGPETDQSDRAREIFEKPVSRDPVRRHAWLFVAEWLEYSADELDDDLDIDEREKRVDERRAEAMTNIWSVRGFEGALALLSDGDGWTVGRYAARCATDPDAAIDVLRACLATETESPENLDAFIAFIEVLDDSEHGTGDDGRVDVQALSRWVDEVRRVCREHGRSEIGDEQIGQLLSRAPSEEDGSWPCRQVCEVLERTASPAIGTGFRVGVYNARGVVFRSLDEGGAQERKLSARYRVWAERWTFEYPYVANILERIAKSYDHEAEREDADVLLMKRL